ncbi:uncharacterized protein BBA_07853 [Beauveria bassiana ARSEF 2860]|uniref:Uncharacterized protein n=1 Tax=Beauveria bassiana (strain ARSEF 2860) TaxID=655819 RepID=J5JAU2_BEAB2|nr:uncharacterized protein BBA_07853 [Beauveria bassiana ARSEF 2860]EJP63253.1 hypothetical protein BBA_07853 [Beauveria bassiana ARSEF 2860]
MQSYPTTAVVIIGFPLDIEYKVLKVEVNGHKSPRGHKNPGLFFNTGSLVHIGASVQELSCDFYVAYKLLGYNTFRGLYLYFKKLYRRHFSPIIYSILDRRKSYYIIRGCYSFKLGIKKERRVLIRLYIIANRYYKVLVSTKVSNLYRVIAKLVKYYNNFPYIISKLYIILALR